MKNDIKNDINIKLNVSEVNNTLFLAINSVITINKLKFKSDEELDLFITKFIYNNHLIAKRVKFMENNEDYITSLIEKIVSKN